MRTAGDARRRGTLLLTVAVLLILACTFLAFTIDAGYMRVLRYELRFTADSASLASVREVRNGTDDVRRTARQTAADTGVSACSFQLAEDDVVPGTFDRSTRTFAPDSRQPNAVQVTVRSPARRLFFSALFGREPCGPSATATAMLVPRDIAIVVAPAVNQSQRAALTDALQALRDLNAGVPSDSADRVAVVACSAGETAPESAAALEWTSDYRSAARVLDSLHPAERPVDGGERVRGLEAALDGFALSGADGVANRCAEHVLVMLHDTGELPASSAARIKCFQAEGGRLFVVGRRSGNSNDAAGASAVYSDGKSRPPIPAEPNTDRRSSAEALVEFLRQPSARLVE